jgi:ankyrin repeat protein
MGNNVLRYLVTKNMVKTLQTYLLRKPDINYADIETGETALSVAVEMQHVDCIRVLLEAGADPNLVSNDSTLSVFALYKCFRI